MTQPLAAEGVGAAAGAAHQRVAGTRAARLPDAGDARAVPQAWRAVPPLRAARGMRYGLILMIGCKK